MNHASLFTGIGGFDLAARNCGIENIFQVEIDDFCQKVLEKNFPETEKYRDIKQFDGTKYKGKIDIISGGFPCQDISIAGIKNGRKRLQGERSGLFFEMIGIINEIKPKYVVWENSIYAKTLIPEITSQFKRIKYDCWQKEQTAREYGFPHKRARLYGVCISNANGFGRDALWNFNSKFNQIYKSKEIFRMSTARKTEFNRTYSPLLQEISDTEFLRTFDGIPTELDANRIKALGNAIVPQIAETIFKAILECENN